MKLKRDRKKYKKIHYALFTKQHIQLIDDYLFILSLVNNDKEALKKYTHIRGVKDSKKYIKKRLKENYLLNTRTNAALKSFKGFNNETRNNL